MSGHRVLIAATLKPSRDGGLRGSIVEGHRSVAYSFDSLEEEGGRALFGALVERIYEGGDPGDQLVAVLRFYAEGAAVFATRGVEFGLWYGHPRGAGIVVEVLPDYAGLDDEPFIAGYWPEPWQQTYEADHL